MKNLILSIILILGIISFIGGYLVYVQLSQNEERQRTYPPASNYDSFTISQLKEMNAPSGNFNTEGHIVKIYTCPSCPLGAMCKPCMGNNIVISEENKLIEGYSLSDKDIILFANNPKQFELGKKYTFSIEILGRKTTGDSLNDIEIIGYDILS